MIPDLLRTPLPRAASYNELTPDGITPRAHWAPFLESLQAIGADELAHRWSRAERRIRENGVTYNIYTDPLGSNRPWKIDPIPFLIPPEEWRFIEAGIIQRAQLLSLLLADLYSAQKLLLDGSIPAALVFANPAFLRPLAHVRVPEQTYLHLLAVDLARSPDGQWWILGDRTQAPSGAGYALENRTIISDLFPDQFRESNVRRLASFFRTHREVLINLSGSDRPRIVLLTPGPYNETYFEHSYLARYLGFTLVEGADLTVRDRRVYLKTLEGLQAVDVILRRVDDSFCDPLELRGDSFLGVAGLVDAIAAGSVKVVNALGSGVIETAGIMPFLPGLAQRLLGEPLKIPSVATWWCGQDYALEWVLEHLNQVVVKPAFPLHGMQPVFGADLSSAEEQKLIRMVRARPYEYVAQERVALSTVPVWDKDQLYSRGLVIRTYVLNTGSGYVAMPGALVRVSEVEGPVVSMQGGGHSKDCWILWDTPVDAFSMLPPRHQPLELRRGSPDLPSRVADNLFWLGRYAERSECTARLLRTLITRVRRATGAELPWLLRLHSCFDTDHSTLPKDRVPNALDLENELISLMTDSNRPYSLISSLDEVHRIGNNVRERLSDDMTRLISQLTEAVRIEEYMLFVEYSAVLTGCLELLSSFSGLERENITRGPGWIFMSLGRRLERAMYSARQLQELTAPLGEDCWPLLEYLLEVADSSMTYRSRYFTSLQPTAVLDVLMADKSNPRSLSFQLSHLVDLYQKLPRHVPDDLRAMQRAALLLCNFDLQNLDYPPANVAQGNGNFGERTRLERALRDLEVLLPSWSENVSRHYFSHARTFAITIEG